MSSVQLWQGQVDENKTIIEYILDLTDNFIVCFLHHSYGMSANEVFFVEEKCEGSEHVWQDCLKEQLYSQRCNHSRDVGLSCGELFEEREVGKRKSLNGKGIRGGGGGVL